MMPVGFEMLGKGTSMGEKTPILLERKGTIGYAFSQDALPSDSFLSSAKMNTSKVTDDDEQRDQSTSRNYGAVNGR